MAVNARGQRSVAEELQPLLVLRIQPVQLIRLVGTQRESRDGGAGRPRIVDLHHVGDAVNDALTRECEGLIARAHDGLIGLDGAVEQQRGPCHFARWRDLVEQVADVHVARERRDVRADRRIRQRVEREVHVHLDLWGLQVHQAQMELLADVGGNRNPVHQRPRVRAHGNGHGINVRVRGARERGVLLRPLGDVVVVLPPPAIDVPLLDGLCEVLYNCLTEVVSGEW